MRHSRDFGAYFLYDGKCVPSLFVYPYYFLIPYKNLYASRWGIETSFRDLKYSIGLVNFHAKKKEGILQERLA